MTGRRRRRPAHSATGRRSRLLGQRRAVPRQAAWPPAQMGAGRPWVARPCRLRTSRARRPGAAVAGRRRPQTVLTVAIRLGARSRRSRLLGLHPSDDQYQSDQTPARHPSGPASDPGDLRYSWTWKCPTQRRVRVHVESPPQPATAPGSPRPSTGAKQPRWFTPEGDSGAPRMHSDMPIAPGERPCWSTANRRECLDPQGDDTTHRVGVDSRLVQQ
jgi:hypothetical protein